MQKHNDAMKTSGHRSLEKYTSHFIERVVCERELETEQRLQHIDTHPYGHNSVSFSFSWGPSLSGTCSSFQHLLSNWSDLQLTWTSCRWGYIKIWHPLFFLRASQFCTQFNPSTVKVISWYSLTGCTCYLHRCISYFDSLAGSEVNVQQTFIRTLR